MRSGRWPQARCTALVMLLVGALWPLAALPQDEQPPPFLLTLKGDAVVLNYTPGGLDRAYHVQQRLELLVSDFVKTAKNPLRMRVFVLTRDEWNKFGFGLPYGLPGRIRGSTLAVPWLGDDGTLALWTRIMGAPPPPLPGIPLKGTAEEATTLAYSDLLTEVEAARALMTMGGIRGEKPWVHQVLAHLIARDAFVRYEGPRLGEIDGFFDDLGRSGAPASLDRYVEGLDLETLLWFESRFQDGARRILEHGKRNEAREILKATRKAGGLLTEKALLERHPHLIGWLAEAFGGGPTS